jgi:hypothetical protein
MQNEARKTDDSFSLDEAPCKGRINVPLMTKPMHIKAITIMDHMVEFWN